MTLEPDRLLRGEKLDRRWAIAPLPVLQKLHDTLVTGPTPTLRMLQTIRRPVLIVTAGKDDFFAPAIGDQMRANIKDSELIHYRGDAPRASDQQYEADHSDPRFHHTTQSWHRC